MKTPEPRPLFPLLLKKFSFDSDVDGAVNPPPLPTAEERAASLNADAEWLETRGKPDLAKESREAAAVWRQIATLPDEKAVNLDAECHRIANEAIDKLLVRAASSESAYAYLICLLHQLLSGFHTRAAHGSDKAARILVSLLGGAVQDFALLAHHKPEIFRQYARESGMIPGMISRKTERAAWNKRLLERLEQGEDCSIAIVPNRKRGKVWKGEDKANALALRLTEYIGHYRKSYDRHKRLAEEFNEAIPQWLHDAAKLPAFCRTSWNEWADIAWRVIAEDAPQKRAGLHPAFYDPKPKICDVRKRRKESFPTFEGKDVIHDSPSIAEHDIKEKLFGAFQLIATSASARQERRAKASRTKDE